MDDSKVWTFVTLAEASRLHHGDLLGAHFKTVPVGEASESFAPVPQKRRQAATGQWPFTHCVSQDRFDIHIPFT